MRVLFWEKKDKKLSGSIRVFWKGEPGECIKTCVGGLNPALADSISRRAGWLYKPLTLPDLLKGLASRGIPELKVVATLLF